MVKANLEVRPHFCTKDRPASRTSKLFWPPQPNRTQSTLQYGNPCNCTLTKSYLTWLTLHYKFRVLCLNSSFPLPLSVFPNPSPCINIPRSVARLFVNKVTKLWQKLNLGFLKLNCVVNTLITALTASFLPTSVKVNILFKPFVVPWNRKTLKTTDAYVTQEVLSNCIPVTQLIFS